MPYGRSKDGTKNDKGEKYPDLSGESFTLIRQKCPTKCYNYLNDLFKGVRTFN